MIEKQKKLINRVILFNNMSHFNFNKKRNKINNNFNLFIYKNNIEKNITKLYIKKKKLTPNHD